MQDLPEEYHATQFDRAQAIGERLRDRRIDLALTQDQLRARLELELVYISRTQYSRIENGDSLLNVDELIALQRVLEVSFEWILLGKSAD